MSNVLVLETCPSSRSGGAERSTRALCEVLSSQGHGVYLAYQCEGDYITGNLACIYSGITHINVPVLIVKNSFRWLSDWLFLVKYCRDNNISHVISHVIHAAPLIRLVGSAAKVKTGMLLKWRLNHDKAGMKVRWGMAGINRHVAVSDYTLQYWRNNGVPPEGSCVVPEGIVTSEREYSSGRSSDDFLVAFAGRIIPQKGLHVLIQAIGRLLNRDCLVRLAVAGIFQGKLHSDPIQYHCELERLVDECGLAGRVEFLGFVDAVETLFASADLVVMPSILPEAQPLVLMQAMAVGKIVLATDIGGTGEIFRQQYSQLLFAPDNVDELRIRIEQVMKATEAERSCLGMQLRHYVQTKYPSEILLAETASKLGIE